MIWLFNKENWFQLTLNRNKVIIFSYKPQNIATFSKTKKNSQAKASLTLNAHTSFWKFGIPTELIENIQE